MESEKKLAPFLYTCLSFCLRAACDKAKHCDMKSKEREVYMFEAFEHAKRGLSIDEKCGACHRVSSRFTKITPVLSALSCSI